MYQSPVTPPAEPLGTRKRSDEPVQRCLTPSVESARPLIARQRELQLLDACLTSARSVRRPRSSSEASPAWGRARLAESLTSRLAGPRACSSRWATAHQSVAVSCLWTVRRDAQPDRLRRPTPGEGRRHDLGAVAHRVDRFGALSGVASPDVGLERSRLFTSVLRVFHHLGEHQPVMPVVEDVHWADSSSLDLPQLPGPHRRAGTTPPCADVPGRRSRPRPEHAGRSES